MDGNVITSRGPAAAAFSTLPPVRNIGRDAESKKWQYTQTYLKNNEQTEENLLDGEDLSF